MPTPQKTRRLDIQGLRAVASLLVAAYHIWFGGVSGGVDVFFVIGGYLLASSLLREVERDGRVDVPRALWRNAQRLFPMAVIVLVVVGSIALAVAGPLGMQRIATDVLASATYWENWRLAADATDYVAAGHDKSPFQHFWAMGAQGQFTAMCIIAAGLFALVAGALRLRRPRIAFGAVLAVAALASFAYAIIQLGEDPVPTYYDTFARVWELALGGAAALLLARLPLHRVARALMGAVGIAMVLTAGLLPGEWLEPGWVTLYPVVGGLLVLLAGDGVGGDGGPVNRLLQWRPLVWVGGISYGLYLWHWPVLKGFIGLFPEAGAEISLWEGLLILGVSIALAYGSFRLIAWAHAERRGRRHPVLALAMPVVAIASVVGVVVAPAVQRDAIETAVAAAPVATDDRELEAWIAEAAQRAVEPAPGAVVGEDGRSAEWLVDDCLTVDVDSQERCFFDDSPGDEEVWIVGDSQAVTWAPAVRRALGGAADVQLLGREMCPFSSGEVVTAQIGWYTRICDAHTEDVLRLAEQRRPALVLISYGAWWVGEGYEDRAVDTGRQLAQGTLEHVDRLHELGVRTAWLDSPPPVADPAACLEAHVAGEPLDACATTLQPAQLLRHETLGALLADGGVDVVETLPWFCDVDAMVCPLVVEGVPTWVDQTHMGAAASAMRSRVVADALLPLVPLRG